MENNYLAELIKIFILLILSAFFSGSESALFSIDYITKEKLKKQKERRFYLIYKLLQAPNKLLVTILIGNMFVNIFASSTASGFAISIFNRLGFNDVIGTTIAIWVMSILIIIFGEIAPKIIAISDPLRFSKLLSQFVYIITIIFTPLSFVFQHITDFITNKIIKYKPEEVKKGEIKSIIRIGYKEGVIEKGELDIIENIIENIDKEVSKIMTPRINLFMLDINLGYEKLIKTIIKSKYTRVLIYQGNRDNILGIIRKKDLLPVYLQKVNIKDIKKFIKPVIFVPENKKINDLLKEFQTEKKDFAVIVDEYGGTAGAVTIENIIAAIIGKYPAEYTYSNLKKISSNKYLISGDTKIYEFNEMFNTSIKSKKTDTISGFILEHLERIPKLNEEIKIGTITFVIKKLKGPKIMQILVKVMK